MKHLLFIPFLAGLLASCSYSGTTKLIQIPAEAVIRVEQTATPLKEISREVQYIPLETTPECLIRQVKDFIIFGNVIYVNNGGKTCLKFGTDGKFLGNVGSNGRGPQEYLYLDEITVSGDRLLIFDSSAGGSVLVYKLSGEFETRLPLKETVKGFTSLMFLPDGNIAAFLPDKGYPSRKAMLTFGAPDGAGFQVVDSITHPHPIAGPAEVNWYFKEGQFIRTGKETKFKCTLNDTVYKVQGKQGKYAIVPQYVFELGPYAAIVDAREKVYNSFRSTKMFQPFREMAQIELLGESDRYIFYSAKDEPLYFYDKKAGVVHKWQLLPDGKEEQCKVNPKFYTPVRINAEGELIGTMLPQDEEDNPVLVVAKLK